MKLELHTKPEVPLEAESITPAVINKLKAKEIVLLLAGEIILDTIYQSRDHTHYIK